MEDVVDRLRSKVLYFTRWPVAGLLPRRFEYVNKRTERPGPPLPFPQSVLHRKSTSL